jgi:uncharacterized protein
VREKRQQPDQASQRRFPSAPMTRYSILFADRFDFRLYNILEPAVRIGPCVIRRKLPTIHPSEQGIGERMFRMRIGPLRVSQTISHTALKGNPKTGTFRNVLLSTLLALLAIGIAGAPSPCLSGPRAQSSANGQPLKALFVTGGLWHDYKKLAPYITKRLAEQDKIQFQVVYGLEVWRNPRFAEGYDLIIYDLCFDDAERALLDNALAAGKSKPTVFLHCAVHSFRNSAKVHEWEDYIGLRSKVHDKFGPFEISAADPGNFVLANIPAYWKTKGDELYQTIQLLPDSRPLLQATSPIDGRTHIVAWTHSYGSARVFGTTLGHDAKTVHTAPYQHLLANAVLWVCGRDGPG